MKSHTAIPSEVLEAIHGLNVAYELLYAIDKSEGKREMRAQRCGIIEAIGIIKNRCNVTDLDVIEYEINIHKAKE